MTKVTSKLQVTLPKMLAEKFGIKPGDHIEWEAAGEVIRVIPASRGRQRELDPRGRLRLFDQATARQRRREVQSRRSGGRPPAQAARGWTRPELYRRGGSR